MLSTKEIPSLSEMQCLSLAALRYHRPYDSVGCSVACLTFVALGWWRPTARYHVLRGAFVIQFLSVVVELPAPVCQLDWWLIYLPSVLVLAGLLVWAARPAQRDWSWFCWAAIISLRVCQLVDWSLSFSPSSSSPLLRQVVAAATAVVLLGVTTTAYYRKKRDVAVVTLTLLLAGLVPIVAASSAVMIWFPLTAAVSYPRGYFAVSCAIGLLSYFCLELALRWVTAPPQPKRPAVHDDQDSESSRIFVLDESGDRGAFDDSGGGEGGVAAPSEEIAVNSQGTRHLLMTVVDTRLSPAGLEEPETEPLRWPEPPSDKGTDLP